MIYLLILLPIIAANVVYWYFRKNKKLNLGDEDRGVLYLMLLTVPTILTVITIFTMDHTIRYSKISDTEYWSFYYSKIRHLDRWNEYIHRTCTRMIRDSRGNTRTETYDCSYVEYHPERWILVDNGGNEIYTSKEYFDSIKTLWNTKPIFVDMHRNYYTVDGDAQEYYWDQLGQHLITYSLEMPYINKIKGTQTAFRLRDVSKEEAKLLGLFDYPGISGPNMYEQEQNPILGFNPGKEVIKKFTNFNAREGSRKKIRVFVLVFKEGQGPEIAEEQKNYWQGGNKNELVICVGIDKSTHEVKWADCFSWQDDVTLDTRCKLFLQSQKKLDLDRLHWFLRENIGLWKKKDFRDFDYLEPELDSDDDNTIIMVVLCILLVSTCAQVGTFWYYTKKDEKDQSQSIL